jgi:hypothetical protein
MASSEVFNGSRISVDAFIDGFHTYVYVRFGSIPGVRDNLRIFRLGKLLSCFHRLLSAKSRCSPDA